jgi:hypothetical protein
MKRAKLDENAMLSELSGSAFFRGRTPAAPTIAQSTNAESAHAPITPRQKAPITESAHAPFDLSKKPTEKRGHRFVIEEIWAIEDVKAELNREMDLGVSQEDIVRAGVHFVIDDYRKNKQNSILVKMVTKKRR